MKVLVTGATGFTGGHLARHLLDAGHEVAILVRPQSRARAGDLERAGADVRLGDLTDAAAVARASRGCEVVYHIAATYREAAQGDAAYTRINVDGTRHVLDAAVAAGARRVVHCSTGGVHGHIEHPPANEDAPLAPGDVYQRTKLEAERVAAAFGSTHPIEIVIARPIGIYGPGDTRFLKMFRGLARGRFPMLGRGDVFYHLTFISDLVRGFQLCGEVPRAAGRTYILAGPEYTTLGELVALIATELGVQPPHLRLPVWPVWLAGALCEAVCVPMGIEPPLFRRRVDFYRKSRAFDTTRAREELGYNPTIDLKTGIHRTAEWYKQQGLL
ncbi:MAG TPA: NAD-dependent epimerase/dehydratase family protein [Vicinamibacterales bacterium]|jgi:nucleoside-diphosphate-sugar epimerase